MGFSHLEIVSTRGTFHHNPHAKALSGSFLWRDVLSLFDNFRMMVACQVQDAWFNDSHVERCLGSTRIVGISLPTIVLLCQRQQHVCQEVPSQLRRVQHIYPTPLSSIASAQLHDLTADLNGLPLASAWAFRFLEIYLGK